MSKDSSVEVFSRLLKTSLKLPYAKINRTEFLKKELSGKVPEEQLQKAIKETPAKANVDKEVIEKIASSCINWQTLQVTAISFATGLPGGWYMAGTIPADLAQFYWHAIQLVQKLVYLYGWPELFDDEEQIIDDDSVLKITIFIGVMLGAGTANQVLKELAEKLSTQVVIRLPKEALTKYGVYNLTKQIAKWIGVKMTKASFSRFASKLVPILGGFISGGISLISMKHMGKRLNNHLKSLPLANFN